MGDGAGNILASRSKYGTWVRCTLLTSSACIKMTERIRQGREAFEMSVLDRITGNKMLDRGRADGCCIKGCTWRAQGGKVKATCWGIPAHGAVHNDVHHFCWSHCSTVKCPHKASTIPCLQDHKETGFSNLGFFSWHSSSFGHSWVRYYCQSKREQTGIWTEQ